MGLQWTEILLILFVLMILFGASRLPQLGSSLGSAIRNFKKGFSGEIPDEPEEAKKLTPGAPGDPVGTTEKVSSKQS